jgi:hypothetical protein
VWSVECGVWSVECGVWSVECGVRSAEGLGLRAQGLGYSISAGSALLLKTLPRYCVHQVNIAEVFNSARSASGHRRTPIHRRGVGFRLSKSWRTTGRKTGASGFYGHVSAVYPDFRGKCMHVNACTVFWKRT